MTEYTIQECSVTGQFEIIQLQPVVVGSFAIEAMAEKVAAFLNGENQEGRVAPKDTENSQETSLRHTPEEATVDSGQPAASATLDGPWTSAELKKAFALIEAGQTISEVAERFGKSMPQLRGKWVGHQRKLARKAMVGAAMLPAVTPQGPTPVETAKAAISDLQQQAKCRVCERPFKVTADRQDLCARCSDD